MPIFSLLKIARKSVYNGWFYYQPAEKMLSNYINYLLAKAIYEKDEN